MSKKEKPNVNWGRGRLRPYESMLSFLIKFCTFNGLSLIKCRKFFSENIGDDCLINGFSGRNAKYLSVLIGEPLKLIKSLCFEPMPSCFGGVFLNKASKNLKFCPECVRYGYHGMFHDLAWIKNCFIHNTPLESVFSPGVEEKITTLRAIFNKANEKWMCPGFGAIELPNKLIVEKSAPYRRWSKITSELASNSRKELCWVDNRGDRCKENSLFFSRISWLNQIPPSVASLLSFKIKKTSPVIINLPINISDRGIHRIDDILRFYCMTKVLSGELNDALRMVENELLSTVEHLDECKCQWFFEPVYCYWEKMNRRDWPIGRRQCPHEIVFNYLKFKWFTMFHKKNIKENCESMRLYLYAGELVKEFGLAELRKSSCKIESDPFWEGYPYFYWIGDANLSKSLDMISEVLVGFEMAGLKDWLRSIDGKNEPPEINYFLPIKEFYRGNDLMVWVWPPIASQ